MSESVSTRNVKVANRQGIHARAATLIAHTVRRFDAKVIIVKDRERVEGTNVLHMLSLGAECGAELQLEATGRQAQEALDALADLIANQLHLEEDHPAGT
ncbi:MAG: HPr family phosphocarrier protein [Planctomycetota bacterium]